MKIKSNCQYLAVIFKGTVSQMATVQLQTFLLTKAEEAIRRMFLHKSMSQLPVVELIQPAFSILSNKIFTDQSPLHVFFLKQFSLLDLPCLLNWIEIKNNKLYYQLVLFKRKMLYHSYLLEVLNENYPKFVRICTNVLKISHENLG